MNISHGKTDRTIKYLTVSDNVYIVSKGKAWMNERLMIVWYEKLWLRYVFKRTKETDFLKAHFMDDVVATMLMGHTVL